MVHTPRQIRLDWIRTRWPYSNTLHTLCQQVFLFFFIQECFPKRCSCSNYSEGDLQLLCDSDGIFTEASVLCVVRYGEYWRVHNWISSTRAKLREGIENFKSVTFVSYKLDVTWFLRRTFQRDIINSFENTLYGNIVCFKACTQSINMDMDDPDYYHGWWISDVARDIFVRLILKRKMFLLSFIFTDFIFSLSLLEDVLVYLLPPPPHVTGDTPGNVSL